jgi:hypothetical protein
MCGGIESDGKANTRPESTDYDGFYMELGGDYKQGMQSEF